MQTFPGLQINWCYSVIPHPWEATGQQRSPRLHRQCLPAAWGSGFGVKSLRTKPWCAEAPQAGSSLSLCAFTSTLPSLFFFLFFFFRFSQ